MTATRSKPSVLVGNLSSPEINHLAIELERRGLLSCYVRPYVNRRRTWERVLECSPAIGRTIRRRTPPEGLSLARVVGAGITQDLVAALLGRATFTSQTWRQRMARKLLFSAERAVAKRAGALASAVDIVVASYGTARFAFEAVHRSGGRAVLNYPIANNHYQARLYREDAELTPRFAAALPRLDELPPDYSKRLDIECEIADCILVGSSFARSSFIELGYDPGKLVVAPYGVDTERFAPLAQPRCDGVFRVLFVGQIGQRKGVGYLLEAYRLFRKHDSELHLVGSYVSGGEVYAPYRDMFRHTAHIPQQELPTLLRQADVLVLPTLIEGMPLVVLEAMACGVPVITTTHGPGDIVRDGIDGFFVPIRDSLAIAERLEQLYRDPERRLQMGRCAREQALRHTWREYSQRAAEAVLSGGTGAGSV
jgi:glycosyltransferase involved in cell wall biosynthesis